MIHDAELARFVHESNRIEGIERYPTTAELTATAAFLEVPSVRPSDLIRLVSVYEPMAVLRDRAGLDVRVGNHIAPPGGPNILMDLGALLFRADTDDPWAIHIDYETLHPFTDGNGRSGRALWAWQMVRLQRGLPLGFLHQFYYQTLERARRKLPHGLPHAHATPQKA